MAKSNGVPFVVRVVVLIQVLLFLGVFAANSSGNSNSNSLFKVCAKFTDITSCKRAPDCRFEVDLESLQPSFPNDDDEDGLASVPTPTSKDVKPNNPKPTRKPTIKTRKPSKSPTAAPTRRPKTLKPTIKATDSPTRKPKEAQPGKTTKRPTPKPSKPTKSPSSSSLPWGYCVPKCNRFLTKPSCPDEYGCEMKKGKCTKVRGVSITTTHRPTASPVGTCRFTATIEIPVDKVSEITVSPESGHYLVISTLSSDALLYYTSDPRHFAEYRLISRLDGHSSKILATTISFDERFVITSSLDRTARLYDIKSGQLRFSLGDVHTGAVVDAAFPHAAADIVATASHDSTAALWNTATGELIARLRGHNAPLSNVFFLPVETDTLITSSYDGNIIMWSTRNYTAFRTMSHGDPVYGMVVSTNGQLIAAASNTISIFSSVTGLRLSILSGHHDIVNQLIFSPDQSRLLSLAVEDNAMLWDLDSGRHIATMESNRGLILDIELTNDYRFLTLFSNGIENWDARGGRFLNRARVPQSDYWVMRHHKQSSTILAAGGGGQLSVFSCA